MRKKKANRKTDPIFTGQQIEDAEARDHGGYGPVRQSLLLMLTQSVDEIAQGAIKNPELREELLQVAEHSVKYFEWLEEDKKMVNCGWARLILALQICGKEIGE